MQDKQIHQQLLNSFNAKLNKWQSDVALANQMISSNEDAFNNIFNKLSYFSNYYSKATIQLDSDKKINLSVYIDGQKTIPTETKSLLKRGDVSIKAMPKTKYYELYQDHVCSIAYRVAKEVFALFPAESVVITVFDVLLNKSTGHLEDQAILSILIPEATIEKLNLDGIDPSEALVNFSHTMDFKKTQGFSPVDALFFHH